MEENPIYTRAKQINLSIGKHRLPRIQAKVRWILTPNPTTKWSLHIDYLGPTKGNSHDIKLFVEVSCTYMWSQTPSINLTWWPM